MVLVERVYPRERRWRSRGRSIFLNSGFLENFSGMMYKVWFKSMVHAVNKLGYDGLSSLFFLSCLS